MPPYRLVHPRGNSRKLAGLTDLEHRVWIQYLLSADDFGVLLKNHHKLQADNRHLSNRKPKELMKCLGVIEACGLVRSFVHQGDTFLYQHNWQDFQRVTWPAKTTHPPVPSDLLANCTEATRMLFLVHPGARKAQIPKLLTAAEVPPAVLQSTAEVPPILSGGTSATREELTLIENPKASSSKEGSARETGPPTDAWWMVVLNRYPQARRKWNRLTEEAFMQQMNAFAAGPDAAWVLFQANLELNIASDEWGRGYAPNLDKYITEGRWQNVLTAKAESVISTPKTAGNAAAIQRFMDRGKAS